VGLKRAAGQAAAWRCAAVAGLTLAAGLVSAQPGQAAEPVVNVTPPSVSGTPQFRGTLIATPGEWTPGGLTFGYRWLRAGVPISGAVEASYRLGLDDIRQPISVQVTASDGVETVTALSEDTAAVTKARFTSRRPPTLSGVARYSRRVSASRGTWSPRPTAVRYQWLRAGRPIRGATTATYRLKARDVGKRVTIRVTARREGYRRALATSAGVKVRHRVRLRRVATYHLETRGRITTSRKRFTRQAQQSYDDPRGWRAQGVKFRRVPRGGDFTLVLAEAAWVPRFSAECSATWSCRVGRFVIINQDRWKSASPAWNAYGRSRRDYRHLVVNHETGHWLGRGHLGCPAPGRKAPVMMQQSKGLGGCRANPWPTDAELRDRNGRRSVVALGRWAVAE
jgi:Protein of unknown function (DUF3152)